LIPILLLTAFNLLARDVAVAANAPAEIRAVMTAQVAAWNRGDIDGFMAGYARSANTEFVSGDKSPADGKPFVIITARNTTAGKKWGR
jgi:hypothetical protein